MTTVVTDNLDEHTIFVSYSFYVGEGLFDKIQIMNRMYCTKNLKNLLFDIKLIAISTKKSPFPYSESRGNTRTASFRTPRAMSWAIYTNQYTFFLISFRQPI